MNENKKNRWIKDRNGKIFIINAEGICYQGGEYFCGGFNADELKNLSQEELRGKTEWYKLLEENLMELRVKGQTIVKDIYSDKERVLWKF
jgi:hypothetical protein